MSEDVTPPNFLKSAIRAVPVVKYALGVGGIVAVIGIIKTFRVSSRDAILGTVIMLVLMAVLVVGAKFAALTTGNLRTLISVFGWFCLTLFMATALCLFLSGFFGWPLDLRGEIRSSQSQAQEQPKTEIPEPDPLAANHQANSAPPQPKTNSKPKPTKPPNASAATHATTDNMTAIVKPPSVVDPHDKQNWRRYLHTGMTRTDVRQLFGEPDRMSVYNTVEMWDYGPGSSFGRITFSVEKGTPDGSLSSWSEPD